jgi:hypothetical protein
LWILLFIFVADFRTAAAAAADDDDDDDDDDDSDAEEDVVLDETDRVLVRGTVSD